jgi:glucosamine--fructose-6-phosphate aminotransferase (isomerizing)
LAQLAVEVESQIGNLESALRLGAPAGQELERINAGIVALKDASWAIGKDRLRFAAEVRDLAGENASASALDAYAAIAVAVSALEKLELRGRDSAGIHLLVTGHQLDLTDSRLASLVADRRRNSLFTSGAVRTPMGHLSIVYKYAAEIGRLGDNGAALRSAIRGDSLLREALAASTAHAVVLGHTRWASVGMVNEANAHPLNSDEAQAQVRGGADYVASALNGDVDNYAALIRASNLEIAREITTDAKVIPVLMSRRIKSGSESSTAFTHTVREFEGSVAVAANCANEPSRLLLAQRGSGQALLVGAAEDMTIVASELYGLVEHCNEYFRLDGSAGEVALVDSSSAGDLRAVTRTCYDGSPRPFTPADILRASITTRDIDRQGQAHYLKKELFEAPYSLEKTLRGRITEVDGRLRVCLGEEAIPRRVQAALVARRLRKIIVIGQGTAAVAGKAVAAAVRTAFAREQIEVSATTATELSGYLLTSDLSDTLVIAVSQSGTTTDTNRAVDLIRQRQGTVIGIVNRRGSDLTKKAQGVIYTADGRDVEISVASTKAFYGQIAAGTMLAFALARMASCHDDLVEDDVLSGLLALPDAMRELLANEERIGELARRFAPKRPFWAVVGSASNRIAAEEIRIKLSELTYRSISCDELSDKKHIDLSAEPLTLICAAGVRGPVADDLRKEVDIFASHRGVPIIIADEGEHDFPAAAGVIRVPPSHPQLAFVLSAMAGHLFGYHAALAIDEHCLPMKTARIAIEKVADDLGGDSVAILDRLAVELIPSANDFMTRLSVGEYDSAMNASVSARIAVALHAIVTKSEQTLMSRFPGPEAVINELTTALTAGIDQVSRTIDTIRHQAKTVTVGTSRSDEAILGVPLVRAVLDSGATQETLPYNILRTVAALDPAVAEVLGSTRYTVDDQHIAVLRRTGTAVGVPSRTDTDHRLRGTKLLVAEQQQVLAAVGQNDFRPVIIVPEVVDQRTTGIVLLHVHFQSQLPPSVMGSVLDEYRGRLSLLRGTVTEILPAFDESVLGSVSPLSLLTEPAQTLAQHWFNAAAADRRKYDLTKGEPKAPDGAVGPPVDRH